MRTDDPDFVDRDVVQREIHHVDERPQRRGRAIVGFIVALLLVVAAAITYLAISDNDDDGEIDVKVPSVDVDVDVDE